MLFEINAMIAMKILLCLLPVFAHAQITINIHASKTTTDASIRAIGASQSIITADEEKIFHITNQTLKNAVLKLTKRTPTDVFLRGPTPWNDLYKTYGWDQVETVIKPLNSKVLNVETTNVVLNKRETANDDSVEKKEEITLIGKVENKVQSFWKQNQVFDAEIKYNIDVNGLGKVPKFELNTTFGESVKDSKVVAFKSASVEVALSPKTVTTFTLTATKVKVYIEVEYAIMLNGYVASNNEVKLNGHHFWAYDVKDVLKAASLPDTLKANEVITVEFYVDEKVVVS